MSMRANNIRCGLVLVGPHDLGPQHGLVQAELTVQFGHRGRVGLDVDDGVDALAMLGDLVGQPATSPDVDLVDGTTILADDVQERLQRRGYSPLVEGWVKNDHDFVWTHGNLITSCGHVRPRTIRGRSIACVGNRPRLPDEAVTSEIAGDGGYRAGVSSGSGSAVGVLTGAGCPGGRNHAGNHRGGSSAALSNTPPDGSSTRPPALLEPRTRSSSGR